MNSRRPAAVFCNGIGDHLLTLPAIRALSQLFPGRLSLACLPGADDIFFPDLALHASHHLPVNGSEDGVVSFDASELANKLAGCDLLIYLNRALPGCALDLLRLLTPRYSMGLFPDSSLQIDDYSAPPPIPGIWKEKAATIRDLIPPGSRLLAVHAETAAPKMWPADRFRSLLSEFLKTHPDYYALALGETEPEFLRSGAIPRVFSCAGVPLQLSFAIVSVADCFLGVDSCLLHAADLFRIPAVGLFGPSSPDEFGFRFSPGIAVSGSGSMESIDQRDVMSALEDRCRFAQS
jgi:hypothetical protein